MTPLPAAAAAADLRDYNDHAKEARGSKPRPDFITVRFARKLNSRIDNQAGGARDIPATLTFDLFDLGINAR